MSTTSNSLLVGRDDSLSRIRQAIDDAEAGRPSLHVIAGEAGIGKSRLVAEAATLAGERGWRTLSGGCLDLAGGGIPFLPILEAVRELTRHASASEAASLLGPAGSDLGGLIPELRRTDGPARGAPPSEQPTLSLGLAQARLFESFLDFLGLLADAAPLLLSLEDVHWIDRATRDLVTFLGRNLTRERIVMLLTVRTEDPAFGRDTGRWLTELARQPNVGRISLHRLQRDEVGRVLQSISGAQPSPDAVESIWLRTQGNPYFVRELALAPEQTSGGAPHFTLLDLLAARLDGTSDAARHLLNVLAVGGRPVPEPLLEIVSGLEADELRAGLREAIDRQAIEFDRDAGAYRFRHELLRELVEQRLLDGERRVLHERYARTLGSRPELADPVPAAAAAELARHWTAARNATEAYAASVRAGIAASDIAAHAQAQRHFERALALSGRRSQPPERLGLLQQAADAADLAGNVSRGIELLTEALGLAEQMADDRLGGLLHSRLGYLWWASGDGERSLEHHRKAVESVPAEPPTAERARVVGALGGALMGAGRFFEARERSEAAIACAMASEAPAEEARARNMLGSVLVALGEVDAGLEELARSTEMAGASGPVDMLIVTLHNLALARAQAGSLDVALADADRSLATARRAGLERRFGPDLMALRADVLTRAGRWDDAAAAAEEGILLDPAGRGTIYLSAVMGRLHALRGEGGPAAERLRMADEISAGEVDADLAAFVCRVRAEAALAEGRPAEALAAVEAALPQLDSRLDPFGFAPLLSLGLEAAAEIAEDARAGRDEGAVVAIRDRAGPLQHHLALLAGRRAQPAVDAFRALAAGESLRMHGQAQPDDWLQAAAALARIGDPYLEAYARFRAAEADLRTHGVRGAGGPLLAEVHAVATRIGALPLQRRVEALAARARLALRPLPSVSSDEAAAGLSPGAPAPDASAGTGLSPRELEVLRLVAEGRSNGEIGERLFITRKTAGVHVTHILDKLGVSNRVEAAMVAARLGLLGEEKQPAG